MLLTVTHVCHCPTPVFHSSPEVGVRGQNTKQVIQDYDTVFDNSIPFRKNDLLRITSEYRACRACTLCLGTEAAGVSVPQTR
jgi:hypothetical protein